MEHSTELQVVYMPVEVLKPYERNARKHADKDVDAIAQSIEDFGFDDPIGIWGEKNLIVEGHGRLLAAKKLGMNTVPCIRLDHLTDSQRRAYALAHNKTAEMSSWLDDVLASELADITDIDMREFGFDLSDDLLRDKYEKKIQSPHYEITGDVPSLFELVDNAKTTELLAEIDEADIDTDIKDFLRLAAQRHLSFDYGKIAEYYAHADADVQRLMENSGLVIIDVDNAIENGFVKMSGRLQELLNNA